MNHIQDNAINNVLHIAEILTNGGSFITTVDAFNRVTTFDLTIPSDVNQLLCRMSIDSAMLAVSVRKLAVSLTVAEKLGDDLVNIVSESVKTTEAPFMEGADPWVDPWSRHKVDAVVRTARAFGAAEYGLDSRGVMEIEFPDAHNATLFTRTLTDVRFKDAVKDPHLPCVLQVYVPSAYDALFGDPE